MSLDLIAKRGSSSLAWRWLHFEKMEIAKRAIRKLCWKSIVVKDSSTTNLFYHLRTNHSTEYDIYEKPRESAVHDMPKQAKGLAQKHTQQTLAGSFYKIVPYNKKSS